MKKKILFMLFIVISFFGFSEEIEKPAENSFIICVNELNPMPKDNVVLKAGYLTEGSFTVEYYDEVSSSWNYLEEIILNKKKLQGKAFKKKVKNYKYVAITPHEEIKFDYYVSVQRNDIVVVINTVFENPEKVLPLYDKEAKDYLLLNIRGIEAEDNIVLRNNTSFVNFPVEVFVLKENVGIWEFVGNTYFTGNQNDLKLGWYLRSEIDSYDYCVCFFPKGMNLTYDTMEYRDDLIIILQPRK